MARAWHTLMLGLRARGTGRELTATRCERGADIATMLGLPRGTAEGIRALDEHWDGRGEPLGLSGSAIPMVGRIACLAQTMEIFHHSFGVTVAYEMVRARRGRWFDPVVVDCLEAFRMDSAFWRTLTESQSPVALGEVEPEECIVRCDDDRLDVIAEAFARVIDAKSPYTAQHSANVARIAVDAGAAMGMPDRDLRTLRRAALLHDIGKLGVPNTILDKPEQLNPDEMDVMRDHTRHTLEILKRVTRFRQFAATAAAHHERLDGTGYHQGLAREALGPTARLLAVADVVEAVSADRPYRSGMPLEEALGVVRRLAGRGELCPASVEAVVGTFRGLPASTAIEAVQAA
jgi:putative nucleotidyltransferase with HDIG domain